jgi:hypothetical protein
VRDRRRALDYPIAVTVDATSAPVIPAKEHLAGTSSVAPFADRYVLLSTIGEGGMGIVHRAEDLVLGRQVALKRLVQRAGTHQRAAEVLFEREYHTLTRLRHPRIIEVYEYGVAHSGPYYTMELLEGTDLGALERLPVRRACEHLRDVASSLALIHAHRLVHRDVSPRNVRITSDGRAKLIDFGALAPFGPSSDIVGTPQCMTPEAARLSPLDQRTDLFGLGVVAYFILTGRPPYAVRRLEDLYVAWRTAPARPSELAPGIPEALDRLVLSLLDLEPFGRPASAALVIEQLNAIGELEPEPVEHAAESYLSSSRMVGRDRETAWFRERLELALTRRGSEVLIEGPPGIGKTRLLEELAVEAQVKGLAVLRADARAAPEPFGVAAALTVGAFRAFPEVARRTAAPHAGWLTHLSPAVAEAFPGVPPKPLPPDPGERRARLQTALNEWLEELAEERPILFAVDNLEDADDNSAALLATLGSKARHLPIILAMTERAGSTAVAAAAVRMLRLRASRLKLAGLSPESCQELVHSVFGDVANAGRVARLLYDRGAGVPQQCMDLARLLVKRKIAAYASGAWVLPIQVDEAELPDRAEAILVARLGELTDTERSFASALSVESGPVELQRCLRLFDGKDEDAYDALGKLVAEQVLLSESGSYRFAQQSLREALLSEMTDETRKTHHRRSAEAFLVAPSLSLNRRAEAAWHLIESGEEMKGAEILSRAGREFLTSADLHDGSDRVTRALERAVRIYEAAGRSDYELASLVMPLISISFFSASWRTVVEYGERALPLGAKVTGLALGHRLRPYLGRALALIVALVVGLLRVAAQRRKGLNYDLKDAIGWYCAIVPAISGTAAIHLDTERADRICEAVLPLSLLGREHVAGLMCDYARAQSLMIKGHLHEARKLFERQLVSYERPEVRTLLGEGNWKAIYGGILFVLGILECHRFGAGPAVYAEKIHLLDYRMWEMAADQLTLLHHAFRGEATQVERYRERTELVAIQGNTTWQVEVFWPAVLLNADALAGDTVGARRTWQQLERQARDVPSLAPFVAVAHAVYLALRGDPEKAIRIYESVPQELVGVVAWRAYYAQALNAVGRHADAKALGTRDDTTSSAERDDAIVFHLEFDRQVALAELGLGNAALAEHALDGLLSRHGDCDNPLLIGLLHEARASVALAQSDSAGFREHHRAMESRFRGTQNHVLIARSNELAARAAGTTEHGGGRAASDGFITRTTDRPSALPDLTQRLGVGNVHANVLAVLLEATRALSGFLYLHRSGKLELLTSTSERVLPDGLDASLRDRVVRRQMELEEDAARDDVRTATIRHDGEAWHDTAGHTVFMRSAPPGAADGLFQCVLLELPARGGVAVVGGVVLETTLQQVSLLTPEFLEGLASALETSVTAQR